MIWSFFDVYPELEAGVAPEGLTGGPVETPGGRVGGPGLIQPVTGQMLNIPALTDVQFKLVETDIRIKPISGPLPE